jgi:hypothetical protein
VVTAVVADVQVFLHFLMVQPGVAAGASVPQIVRHIFFACHIGQCLDLGADEVIDPVHAISHRLGGWWYKFLQNM